MIVVNIAVKANSNFEGETTDIEAVDQNGDGIVSKQETSLIFGIYAVAVNCVLDSLLRYS